MFFLLLGFLMVSSVVISQEEDIYIAYQKYDYNKDITSLKNYTEKGFLAFLKDDSNIETFENVDQYLTYILNHSQQFANSKTKEYIEISYRLARIFNENDRLYTAYSFIDLTSSLLEEKDLNDLPFASAFYVLQGDYFYKFKRYEEAKMSLWKSIQLGNVTPETTISSLNTLGLINKDLKERDSAIYYFNQALDLAKKEGAEDWQGFINGNLGYIYYSKNNLEKAKKLLEWDREMSLSNNEIGSALNSLSFLVRIYIKQEDSLKIEEKINQMDSLIPYIESLSVQAGYYQAKSIYWNYHKNYENAYSTFNQFIKLRDSLNNEFNQVDLQNMIFQIKFQKEKAKNEVLLEAGKRKSQIYYTLTLTLLIVIVACIIIIYLLIKRKINKQRILELEKIQIEQELKQNEHELQKVLQSLAKKNETILDLTKEIKEKENDEEEIRLHEKIKSFTLLTKNDLTKFRNIFEKIHPNFNDTIIQKYPNLSNAEIRLAMLLKLNLSVAEMANILGISEGSVRRTNLRIRDKTHIKTQSELIKFIHSI